MPALRVIIRALVIVGFVVATAAVASAAQQQEQAGKDTETRADVRASADAGPASVTENCWAAIRPNGTIADHGCVVSAARLAVGRYQVIFNGSVRTCAFSATIGTVDLTTIPPAGEISVADRAGNVNGVYIATRNSAGAYADRPFHLIVLCR